MKDEKAAVIWEWEKVLIFLIRSIQERNNQIRTSCVTTERAHVHAPKPNVPNNKKKKVDNLKKFLSQIVENSWTLCLRFVIFCH